MLFSNDFTPSVNPYVSSYLNDPAYLAALHKLQKKQTGAEVGFGIGEGLTAIGGAVGSAAATYFGGPIAGAAVGAATAAAESGLGAGEKRRLAKIKTQIGDLKTQYIAKDDINDPQIGAHVGNTNTFGNLGSTFNGLGQNKGFMQLIQNMIAQNQKNAFTKSIADKITPSTLVGNGSNLLQSNTDNTDLSDANGNPIQNAPLEDPGFNYNADPIGSGGAGAGGDVSVATSGGFWKGGLAALGKDDIALVDTKDGSDTGIRLQAGEMLVVSRKTLAKLNTALKDGDHKEVYDLMKAQVKVAPTVKNGKEGHVKGGVSSTEIDVDKELADIDKQIKNLENKSASEKSTKAYNDKVNQLGELRSKYQEAAKEYSREKTSGLSDASKLKAQKFQLEQLKTLKGQITDITGGLSEGATLKDSPTMKDNYSNTSDAVYKDGAWYHTQGDNKGQKIDAGLQQKLNDEYIGQQKPRPFANGASGDFGEPDKNIEDTYTAPGKPEVTGADNLDVSDKFAPARPLLDLPSMTPFTGAGAATPDLTKYNVPSTDTKESNTGLTAGDYAKYYAPEALGTGFDMARGVLGFNAANKPLPTFTKPEAWNQYVNRLHGLSETGLTGNEMTAAQRGIDQTYAYDVDNIRNLSGGNSGQALGNLGRAASSHYGALTNLAALNDEARARNLGQYGSVLAEDTNLNRMIFGDKYGESMMNKQAGAQLAHDAISNIQQRGITDRFYGPGSYASQIDQLNLQGAKDTNANTAAMQKYYATHGFASPPVGSNASSEPSYTDYMAYKKWAATQ